MSRVIKGSPAYIDQDRASALLEKWDPILSYESKNVNAIEDEQSRLNTAILLENQERWCLSEANMAGNGGVFGPSLAGAPGQGGAVPGGSDFYAGGDARLPKVLIPMIRRTFPELITNEIVGVQPMSGPVGLVFALRYKYENVPLGGGRNCSDSDKEYNAEGTYNTNSCETSAHGSATPNWARGKSGTGPELGYNYLNTAYTGASSAGLSGLGGVGVTGTDFDMLPEDAGVAQILQNFEFTSNIPQVVISFEKTAVEAGTRRLAAHWSVELEQDLKNMNGIDIDNEITNAMSYEIQAEIDREMIMRMAQAALNAGPSQGYSIWNAASADGRWLGERNRDLYAKIVVEANRIAVRNRRGAANFIIATPRVCAILEMLPEFKIMPMNSTVGTGSTGVAKVGNLGGRFTVYRDTRTDAQYLGGGRKYDDTKFGPARRRSKPLEYCLLGYKGAEYYDTGIVYAPYIPVMVQRTIGPNDFAPRVGIMTRYGVVDHLFGSDLYYHIIIVRGMRDSDDGFQPVGRTIQYM